MIDAPRLLQLQSGAPARECDRVLLPISLLVVIVTSSAIASDYDTLVYSGLSIRTLTRSGRWMTMRAPVSHESRQHR